MLLVVATTEATDPTRGSGPFPSAANVSEFSSKRVRGETRGVTEEVRVGAILFTSHHQMGPAKPMEPIGSISSGEGGKPTWLPRRRPRRSQLPRRKPRRRSKTLLFNRFVSPSHAGVLWSPGAFYATGRRKRKPSSHPFADHDHTRHIRKRLEVLTPEHVFGIFIVASTSPCVSLRGRQLERCRLNPSSNLRSIQSGSALAARH